MDFNLEKIGITHSCFKEKFGIPRQPGLIDEARAVIELLSPFNREELVRGLEGFSHIWVLFLFHETVSIGWKPTVRPPRLGGKKRVGVFASRSPFRPNPIGMSVVKLDEIVCQKGKVNLHISGIDIVDGTPVLDIKPYLPYSDVIDNAVSGYAAGEPPLLLEVVFSEKALQRICEEEECGGIKDLKGLITKMINSDPRPAHYRPRHDRAKFAFKLFNLDIKWRVEGCRAIVMSINTVGTPL